jgi:hypothetical protein
LHGWATAICSAGSKISSIASLFRGGAVNGEDLRRHPSVWVPFALLGNGGQ